MGRDGWAPGDPALVPPPLAPPGDRTRSGGAGRIDSQRSSIVRKTETKNVETIKHDTFRNPPRIY